MLSFVVKRKKILTHEEDGNYRASFVLDPKIMDLPSLDWGFQLI